ncbi:efflux RND transporter periplasmic adaptor subunit [Fictibacillus sp. Mic-4]|uniref:efflux RND transporter periplasmic adaptor subunit n=1 Tax=Fictibacillus sp. Mic-4 TaxID=3132826 RepID=UPI003CE72084
MTRKWKWIGIGAICVLLLSINFWMTTKDKTAAVEANRIKAIQVMKKPIRKEIKTTGWVIPAENESIYYEPQRGLLKEILVKPGDKVTAGASLVAYTNPDLEQKIEKLKEQNEESKVKEKYYKDMQANLNLDQNGSISGDKKEKDKKDELLLKQKKTEAEMKEELARTKSEQLESQISLLEKKKEELTVKSKVGGVVKRVNYPAGSRSDRPLVEIISESYQVKGALSEEEALFVQNGQKVIITSPLGDNLNEKGTVASILPPEQKKASMIYPFYIQLDQTKKADIKNGQRLQLTMDVTVREGALVVPEKAILKEGGKSYVLALNNGYVDKRNVTTGLKEGKFVELKTGVKVGEKIVESPTKYMRENTPVKENESKKKTTKPKKDARNNQPQPDK